MKLFEMFAGYGGASFALKKAGIDFECVGYSEIDRYAIRCYEQNHWRNIPKTRDELWQSKNYGDCTKIDPKELPDFDLLTGGFPCQAFSIAGKGLGELDIRGTLFNDIIRIAEHKQPKYMLLENVKGLLSKRHKETFNKILAELKRIGYIVHWEILNSKDYGVPQNRERVFFVCFRKDIYEPLRFQFPQNEELNIFLKDILENQVDEKYYLSKNQMFNLLNNGNMNCCPSGIGMNGRVHLRLISPTITTNKGEGIKIAIPCLTPDRVHKRQNGRRFKNNYELMFTLNTQDVHGILLNNCNNIIQLNNPSHSNNRVYSEMGIAQTINTMGGGNRQPFIKVTNATSKGFIEGFQYDGISLKHPNSKTRRGRVQTQLAPTLQCNDTKGVILENLTIRKLTPVECFRLMGFLNDEINLEGLSNSQKYKLAGNGWDINLVSKIFVSMFK